MKLNRFVIFLIFIFSCSFVNADTETEWIELIPTINIEKHTVAGNWKKTKSEITVDASENARISLPTNISNNFDLRVSFTRISGEHSIALIFNHQNEQASFEVDAWGQHLAGIQQINGKPIKDNETRVNNIRLENGKKYTLEIRVRDNIITGLLNDQVLVKLYKKDKSLSSLDLWKLPSNDMIGIGAYQSNTVFHSIKIKNFKDDKNNEIVEKQLNIEQKSKPISASLKSLSELSDEFNEQGTLKNWNRVFQSEGSDADQLQTIRIAGGKLTLVPYTSSWYNDYRGVLVYKPVKGDFIVTTKVKATSLNANAAPNKLYSLAGIMIRTPKNITPETWWPGQENYIFLSLGAADKPGTTQFEVKTTINSNSKLEINSAKSTEAEIKVLRIGASFVLLKREGNGNWNVHKRYYRPDMPEILQVGMTVYTDWSNVEKVNPAKHNQMVIRNGAPDLRAQFDYFRFRRPELPENYHDLNFMSAAEVSEQMILDLVK